MSEVSRTNISKVVRHLKYNFKVEVFDFPTEIQSKNRARVSGVSIYICVRLKVQYTSLLFVK